MGPPTEIGIVIYPGAQMASVLGLTDLFVMADRLAGRKEGDKQAPRLKVSHWEIPAASAPPSRVFDSVPGSETAPSVLILPPALGDPVSPSQTGRFSSWLQEQHRAGVTLASVCAGALMLGDAGVLDGRTVTTHWAYGELLQSRCPSIHRVEVDRLIIEDGDIITAGGVMAWTDLGLRLVERFLGPTVMVETARMLLLDPFGREQRHYSSFSPRLAHGDSAVLRVQHWLQETSARKTDLAELASRAGLEERTFLRRFQKATGLTTSEYCQRLRISKAQEILQFTNQPVEQVSEAVGYADVSAFRKAFAKVVGLTPKAFRQRFLAARS